MSAKSKLIKIVLPILILAVGALITRSLVMSRTAPKKEVRENPGALVEILEVTSQERHAKVFATGTVQARRQVEVTPQVSGRVVELGLGFVAGGFFEKGDLLFRIEAIDYRLAVERAGATLAKAEVDLATVQSRARVARLEWDRLAFDGEEPSPLVLYEPQLKNAEAGIASARAALEQARLDLKRTSLYAPFNCRVRSEQVDIGQYLRAGTPVAVIAGTDASEVVVPLPTEELKWIDIPRRGDGKGSLASVRMPSNGAGWAGPVVRSLGEVDERGRMARVVVAVEDPYALKNAGPRLEQGMFVEVVLSGKSLGEIVAIPRRSLRDGSSVWVMDADDLLRIRPVEVLRLEPEEVIIAGGLKEGDRVVLTPLSGAADGMKLRRADEGALR